MIIACLHTADSNSAILDEVAPAGVTLTHVVRADLLKRAVEAGGADDAILDEAVEVLSAMEGDVRLLTCTSIGAAAERVGALRVDKALATQAAMAAGPGGKVHVFVTFESTIGPTMSLFERAAWPVGAEVEVHMVEGAKEAFFAGESNRYFDLIAAEGDKVRGGVVALAQVSMTPAARRMKRSALTSPAAALEAVIGAVQPKTSTDAPDGVVAGAPPEGEGAAP